MRIIKYYSKHTHLETYSKQCFNYLTLFRNLLLILTTLVQILKIASQLSGILCQIIWVTDKGSLPKIVQYGS